MPARCTEKGIHLLSTGGTHKALADAGLPVTDVSELTGFPEIMDGRVKTLHPERSWRASGDPRRCGDQSGDDDARHRPASISPSSISIRSRMFARTGGDYPTTVENIDIGGPAMIRASAKNHAYVTVITDPADYAELLGSLGRRRPRRAIAFRQRMAAKAYARTAAYDAAISELVRRGPRQPIRRATGRSAAS